MKKITTAFLVILVVGAVAAGMALWLRGADERMFSALAVNERPSSARARLQALVDEDSGNLNAQQWLLRLEIEAGDMSAAQNRLNLLQVKAPDYYGTVSNACLFYLIKRQAQKAAHDCERAVELSGRSVEELNRLASALLLIPDYLKALPTLQEAEKKDPANLKVQNNLGYYFILVGISSEAVRILKEVVDKDHNFLEARKNLARAYYENKQYHEAAAEIDRVLLEDPNNKDMLMIMALIQTLHFRDKTKGAEYARRAIAAGMDKQRAEGLLKMLRSNEPAPVRSSAPPPLPKPHPVGPGEATQSLAPPDLPGQAVPEHPTPPPAMPTPAAPAPAPPTSPEAGATP